MITMIDYTASNGSYRQQIDTLNYECTAQDYIDGCRSNDSSYFNDDIGATIAATVFTDDAAPGWDDPVSTTEATIQPED